MKSVRLMCCVLAVCMIHTACLGEPAQLTPPAEDTADTQDGFALIDGVPTQDRPEIGALFFGRGLCTATLIAPRVAITARHCVGYTTCDDNECASLYNARVNFTNATANRAETFKVVAFESYDQQGVVPQDFLSEQISYLNLDRSDYWLSDDVAVMLLEREVPESLAKPATLLDRDAARGESWTIWGYGCTERETRTGSQTKRYYDFIEGNRSNNLCPGDSGGPVTLGRNGGVRYVNSAYTIELNARDVFGDVLYFRRQIDEKLKAWGQDSPLSPSQPDPQQPDPQQPDPQQPEPKFTWVGDACEADQQCNFASGNEIGMCTRAQNQTTGICTLGCEGYCPNISGTAPTFCVSLDGGRTGSCVSQAHSLNDFCAKSPNTTAVELGRYIGRSGAPNSTRTVCAPMVSAPTPPVEEQPKALTPPQNLRPTQFVSTPNVDMSWDAVSGAKDYVVDLFYYSDSQKSWQPYHSWRTERPALQVWPVLNNTSYYFSVSACHGATCSLPSDPQSFYFQGR